MKKIALYTTLLLYFSFTVQAQVLGVNTENPTRSVDVNGKVRITGGNEITTLAGLNDPTNNGANSHIVVADDQGNIGKIPVPATPTKDASLTIISKVVLVPGGSTTATASNQVAELQVAGFAFGVPNGVPSVRTTDGSSQILSYGVKITDRRAGLTGGHSAGSGDGRIYFRNTSNQTVGSTMVPITSSITSGNFSSFQGPSDDTLVQIPKSRTNTLERRDNYRVHLVHSSYPGNFYKVTYFRLQNSGTPVATYDAVGTADQVDIWVINVELYNNQNN